MTKWDRRAATNIYYKLVNIMKSEGIEYTKVFISFSYIDIKCKYRVIFDLNTGSICKAFHTIEGVKTDTKWYYRGEDVIDDDCTIDELKQLLTDLQNYLFKKHVL